MSSVCDLLCNLPSVYGVLEEKSALHLGFCKPVPCCSVYSLVKSRQQPHRGVCEDGKTVCREGKCSTDVSDSMPMLSALLSLSTKTLENPATTLLALASVCTMGCCPAFTVYQDLSLGRLDSSRSLLDCPFPGNFPEALLS